MMRVANTPANVCSVADFCVPVDALRKRPDGQNRQSLELQHDEARPCTGRDFQGPRAPRCRKF